MINALEMHILAAAAISIYMGISIGKTGVSGSFFHSYLMYLLTVLTVLSQTPPDAAITTRITFRTLSAKCGDVGGTLEQSDMYIGTRTGILPKFIYIHSGPLKTLSHRLPPLITIELYAYDSTLDTKPRGRLREGYLGQNGPPPRI
jgi:hypothetical protein